jgi:hypothetical protein
MIWPGAIPPQKMLTRQFSRHDKIRFLLSGLLILSPGIMRHSDSGRSSPAKTNARFRDNQNPYQTYGITFRD